MGDFLQPTSERLRHAWFGTRGCEAHIPTVTFIGPFAGRSSSCSVRLTPPPLFILNEDPLDKCCSLSVRVRYCTRLWSLKRLTAAVVSASFFSVREKRKSLYINHVSKSAHPGIHSSSPDDFATVVIPTVTSTCRISLQVYAHFGEQGKVAQSDPLWPSSTFNVTFSRPSH